MDWFEEAGIGYTVEETFLDYDMTTLLALVRDWRGLLFLASLDEEGDDFLVYLLAPLSEHMAERVAEGEMPLRDVFLGTVDDRVLGLRLDFTSAEVSARQTWLVASELGDDRLADAGATLPALE